MKKVINYILICCLTLSCSSIFFACDNSNSKDNKKEQQQEEIVDKISEIDLGNIVLEENGTLYSKQKENEEYLKSLDSDKLLYFFYKTAGLSVRNGAQPYGGWEGGNTGGSVAGHTLGHYLSAISMLCKTTDDDWYKETVDDIVGELKKCQFDNGFVFTRPESDFDLAFQGSNQNSVIFYTVHKILAGLFDAYRYAANDDALDVASGMMDWIFTKIDGKSATQLAILLRVEYGGMNEVAYDIYSVTKKPEHKKVAEAFNEALYLDNWAIGKDNISGVHANTQIPKAVGFAKGYMITGEEKLLSAAENFWDMVALHRTFVTGGNAENEHFGPVDEISDQFYFNPDETCNIYNMTKLSAYLYLITGKTKYIDYIERALFNGLAGSIDEDGCKTYYQWLSTDALKLFHDETNSFWCCTGTGMETFSKLSQWFAVKNQDGVKINIFDNASYNIDGIQFTLENDGELNKITFTTGGKINLYLRVPYYAKSTLLLFNGSTQRIEPVNGYIKISKTFSVGDVIDYQIVYKAYTESTNDDKDIFGVKYGPYVLAAVGKRYEKKNYIKGSFESGFLSDLTSSVEVTEDGYTLHTDDFDIPMKRYCDIVNERYTVYFERVDTLTAENTEYDIIMHSSLSSSVAYSETHDNKRGHNIWYEYSGQCQYLEAINDGNIGINSIGKSVYCNEIFTYYVPFTYFTASSYWVSADFESEMEVSSSLVYFYNNYATVKAPSSYTVEYWNGSQWTLCSNQSTFKYVVDGYTTITFDKIKTSRIRIKVTATNNKPTGIIEWKVK